MRIKFKSVTKSKNERNNQQYFDKKWTNHNEKLSSKFKFENFLRIAKESIREFEGKFDELDCTSEKVTDTIKITLKRMEYKIEIISRDSSSKKTFLKSLSKLFSILMSRKCIAFGK